MKVLLLGSGGREHALGWKLAQSDLVEVLISAPGNAGLSELGKVVSDLPITDPAAVASYAEQADLVVIGPEAPLAAGVVDALERAGIRAFGPTREAARLESSKSFAKEMMARSGVPSASSQAFDDPAAAKAYLGHVPSPYVVKADGLAGGKGVLVTESLYEARAWVDRCASGGFGAAGLPVIVEEYLPGPELSVVVLCDGREVTPLPPARDYKRLQDGDLGPNTGGMGAYSPVPGLPPGLTDTVVERLIRPVIQALAAEGVRYRGALYAGLSLTPEGPKVLEFNCRLGDPETQAVLPRLEGDLAAVLLACSEGDLARYPPTWSAGAAVDVVLAAAGYPDQPKTGDRIHGLEAARAVQGVEIFHAGTAAVTDGVLTAGGRVLNVVGTAPNMAEARRRAYQAASLIDYPGKHHRNDIAQGAA